MQIGAAVQTAQNNAAGAARSAQSFAPPALAAPSSPAVVAVIGDEVSAAAGAVKGSPRRWPTLVTTGRDIEVGVFAVPGSGYIADKGGTTFGEQAAKIASTADVIVFFGGASDVGKSSVAVAKAASRAFSTAAARAPGAKLVVIGPAFAASDEAGATTAVRSSLRSAAAIAKATWLDPIEQKWIPLPGTRGAAGGDLSAADERILAKRIGTALDSALK